MCLTQHNDEWPLGHINALSEAQHFLPDERARVRLGHKLCNALHHGTGSFTCCKLSTIHHCCTSAPPYAVPIVYSTEDNTVNESKKSLHWGRRMAAHRHTGLVAVRDPKCIHDEDLGTSALCKRFSKCVVVFCVALVKQEKSLENLL
jgi:hypothetical protein